ncbi:hypothetical protein JCM8208_004114 [Rhodotorula glutinis]
MSSSTGKRAALPPSPDDARPPKLPRLDDISPTLQRSSQAVRWLPNVGELKSVLHATFGQPQPSSKVAIFSLEHTLIKPKLLVQHFTGTTEWKWFTDDDRVKDKLRELHDDGFALVIFATLSSASQERVDEYKQRLTYVLRDLNVPVRVFTSTAFDPYRKPAPGAFIEFERRWNLGKTIDKEQSFSIGSAAGASGSLWDWDYKFSVNIGVPFHTAEQYFLGEAGDTKWRFTGWLARKHNHEVPLFMPTNKRLVMRKQRSEWDDPVFEAFFFIGPPSCGKTHMWETRFKGKDYVRLSSADPAQLQRLLERNPPTSIVVDSPLPTRAARRALIRLVEKHSPVEHGVRAFVWNVDEDLAKHNHVFWWLYGKVGGGEGSSGVGERPAWLGEWDWRSWFAKYESVNFEEKYDEVKRIEFVFDKASFGDDRFQLWRDQFLSCYPRDPTRQAWK